MLITRIAAKNYKTYKELDLDLNVNPEQPIVLIGGQNGGGKTTLFQAIYSSLYGLEIRDAAHFKRLINASVPYSEGVRIELEIDFKGKVLNQDFYYKIKRTYGLNAQEKPIESVSLNFNGEVFTYGTAMPFAQRVKAEKEVNKIIKANLPKELSKYFLFDAMESGELLKEDYLTRVIKENIENVMGFNKYFQLKEATTKIKEKYIAESIDIEAEREEYKELVAQKEKYDEQILALKEEQKIKLGYSIEKKELYNKAKDGANLQKEYKDNILLLEEKIKDLEGKQSEYLEMISDFTNEVEVRAFLPKVVDTIYEELQLILSEFDDTKTSKHLNTAQLEFVKEKLEEYLSNEYVGEGEYGGVSGGFYEYLKEQSNPEKQGNKFSFMSHEEIETIKLLLSKTSINNFQVLISTKESVEKELKQLPTLRAQLSEAKRFLTDDDTSIIFSYEKNEARLKDIKEAITNFKAEKDKVELKIHKYDIPDEEIPNPRLELCKKIEPLFDDISSELLKSKKSRIETTMKEDLNSTLVAYAGQIGKVVLSEDLSDLSFKIYHNAGNEIFLEELNAASKQIMVQVLLKALHQFGDYNPPVMIDTVMGYLDEDSRASLLENYFPKLSHQTILLSTDSEIRTNKDLVKIEEFISKKYTLVRDKEKQLTVVHEGYFDNEK